MTDQELQQLLALDSAPGPAAPIDAERADAIVEAALAGAGFGPGPAPGGGGATSAAPAASSKLALVAGAGLAAVAIALLAWYVTRQRPAELSAPPPDALLEDAGGLAELGASDAPPPRGEDDADESSMIELEDTPAADREPVVPERPTRRKPATEEATDLLAAANAKRAEKKWRESDRLYARVVERAPKSLAAQTALVASGSIHLEHLGDPRGAAKRFSRALAIAPRGALAEDARWGLVEAARALRDKAAERAALDEFLAHHPTSPLAPRAKARRAELE